MPAEESLQVREALLGGPGTQQQGPKLPGRRTEECFQVCDCVDGLGDGCTEQAQGAQRVQPRRHQMGPVERLDDDRALVEPGEPGTLPHARSRVCHHLVRRTEVDHHLGEAIR